MKEWWFQKNKEKMKMQSKSKIQSKIKRHTFFTSV